MGFLQLLVVVGDTRACSCTIADSEPGVGDGLVRPKKSQAQKSRHGVTGATYVRGVQK